MENYNSNKVTNIYRFETKKVYQREQKVKKVILKPER
jgi:hypothetical protein